MSLKTRAARAAFRYCVSAGRDEGTINYGDVNIRVKRLIALIAVQMRLELNCDGPMKMVETSYTECCQ